MVKDYREKAQVWGKFGPASLWARTATVVLPRKKPGQKNKNKSTGTRLIVNAPEGGCSPGLSLYEGQHHQVWIAALLECKKAANSKERGPTNFCSLGVRRMVSSVGFRSCTLFVKPPLQELPGLGAVVDGTIVLTVLLSDMHEYVFLDHAME